jgi:hypothetical protein
MGLGALPGKSDIWMVGANGSGEQQITDTAAVLDAGTVGWQQLPVIVGDGHCSGAVDLTDFAALMRYLAGLSTPACPLALNVRCGDGLSAADAVPLYLAGLPPNLPAD